MRRKKCEKVEANYILFLGEKGTYNFTYEYLQKRGQMFSLRERERERKKKETLFHTHALSSFVMITSCERE